MLLLRLSFFLLLIYDSLISFSTSPVIRLDSDLRSIIFHRLNLSLAALSQFPKGSVTKEDFSVCLENWLVRLKKEWNYHDHANVAGANKIAQDLGLTGRTKSTSVQLSDPSDNTRPAPWAVGLSIVLLQTNRQLYWKQEPTALMPWIFIPDGQAFHFTITYWKTTKEASGHYWVSASAEYPAEYNVVRLLVPEPDFSLLKGMGVRLDAIYVRHNRDENPKRKSWMDDLTEYKNNGGLYMILCELMYYPWLRNYVKFGEIALKQLLVEHETQLGDARARGETGTKMKEQGAWLSKELEVLLKEQSKNGRNEGMELEGMQLS